MQIWDKDFLGRSPLFEPLRIHGATPDGTNWPTLIELQAVVSARGILSGGGQPLRLVAQDARSGTFENRYEARLYREGELQLRTHNWHDLFNLMVWITFPRAKAALNARHYQALLDQQLRDAVNRGPAQDALTLFDESGVIVVSCEADLLQEVRDFAWKRLFWEQRERVVNNMRWLVFGHALYEKALQPFIGITAHSVLFEVDHGVRTLTFERQLDLIDEMLASRVADSAVFRATRELAPVPILGVPGWWPANNQSSFYDDTAYFRPGRRNGTAGSQAARGDAG